MDHIAASRKQAIAEAAGTVSDDEEFAELQTDDAADASAADDNEDRFDTCLAGASGSCRILRQAAGCVGGLGAKAPAPWCASCWLVPKRNE